MVQNFLMGGFNKKMRSQEIINDRWFIYVKKRYVKSRPKWKETEEKLITVCRPQKENNSTEQNGKFNHFVMKLALVAVAQWIEHQSAD